MMINGKMTIGELLASGIDILSKNESISTPRLDCEIFLTQLLHCERIYLVIEKDKVLDKNIVKSFYTMVYRRAKNEPVSYIISQKEFMSLKFHVEPGVLIPRPETEFLVEYIIQKMQNNSSPVILDLCTGSGAIAVSLAHYIEHANITAVDKFDICVSTAKRNAEIHHVAERVKIMQADVLDEFLVQDQFDCIISNPPYIKNSVLSTLPDDVKDFEPPYALDGGHDGLLFYRRIVNIAKVHLRPQGILVFEIGYDQGKDVVDIIKESNMFHHIQITKDYAGLDRMITAEKRSPYGQ